MSSSNHSHPFKTIICYHCGKSINVPVYCKNRFCPVCSKRRAYRLRTKLNMFMSSRRPAPGYCFRHLILTIRGGDNPARQLHILVSGFRKLRKTKYWKRSVAGGAFVIEISGSQGHYHVHIHAVIEAKFMSRNHLIDLWSKFTVARGVFIKTITKQAIARYLTKYVLKPVNDDLQVEMISEALKAYRLFQTFGSWHGKMPKINLMPFKCTYCGHSRWVYFGPEIGNLPDDDSLFGLTRKAKWKKAIAADPI
jgi:hypothetical protein